MGEKHGRGVLENRVQDLEGQVSTLTQIVDNLQLQINLKVDKQEILNEIKLSERLGGCNDCKNDVDYN